MTFGPDGRRLCRICYAQLQNAQANARAQGSSTALAPVGKLASKNPAMFVRLMIFLAGLGFFIVVAGVAAAAAAGEALRDCVGR